MIGNGIHAVYVPRRGRPDARQMAAIDQAILSAARALFLKEGYDATAMEVVATAANVSKATLYARYSAKDQLFRAVIMDRIDQWSRLAEWPEPAAGQTLQERLLHYGMLMARTLPHPEVHAFQRLLLSVQARFPDLSLALYETASLPIMERIAEDIAAAAREEGMPVRDPLMIARLFASTMTGWRLQEGAAHPVSEQELEAVARRIVDLFLLARAGW